MDIFLKEYSSESAVKKYTKGTAGYGISYLLDNDYKTIYLEAIRKYLSPHMLQAGINMLEFGCGGGMNIIHLMSTLGEEGIPVKSACGTDFSEKLIEAAVSESRKYLAPGQGKSLAFCVARNENLIEDLSLRLNIERSVLQGSFHLIFGVNTIRYCHRLHKTKDCLKDIFALLARGGICIIIDMNQEFPLFRSKLRNLLAIRNKGDREECYIPSLEEYARPFPEVGFEIITKKNFCWVPHSAGQFLTNACRVTAPLLDLVVPGYAMRSLIIARKPD
jgi:SAM-dependent methyltransferase